MMDRAPLLGYTGYLLPDEARSCLGSWVQEFRGFRLEDLKTRFGFRELSEFTALRLIVSVPSSTIQWEILRLSFYGLGVRV